MLTKEEKLEMLDYVIGKLAEQIEYAKERQHAGLNALFVLVMGGAGGGAAKEVSPNAYNFTGDPVTAKLWYSAGRVERERAAMNVKAECFIYSTYCRDFVVRQSAVLEELKEGRDTLAKES